MHGDASAAQPNLTHCPWPQQHHPEWRHCPVAYVVSLRGRLGLELFSSSNTTFDSSCLVVRGGARRRLVSDQPLCQEGAHGGLCRPWLASTTSACGTAS